MDAQILAQNLSSESPSICIKDASLCYQGMPLPVFNGMTLEFPAGQWSVLVGKSGCGKTSLLRYLAGLLEPTQANWQGDCFVGDLDLSRHENIQLSQQCIAYMAQQDLLMPWLSVIDNVCLSRKFQSASQLSKSDPLAFKAKAQQLLDEVGLSHVANSLPSQLSGGMRQRVALARTLIQDKPIVLMDEPFSALDALTRHQLQNLAAKLLKNKTVVLITHDPQEAYRLGHRVYMMKGHPAKSIELDLKPADLPRAIDGDLASFQQNMLALLEAHDE